LGKIVRGARVAQDAYVLKPPVLTPAAAPVYFDRQPFEHQPLVGDFGEGFDGVPQEPAVDVEAVRAEAAALLDNASRDAEALIRDAQERAASLIADAQTRVVQIEKDAHDTGMEQGLSDGRASAQAEMEEMLETMRGLIEMARIERHKIIEQAEPEIVRLSTAIAERILHKHVSVDPATVLDMTRNAITRIVNRENVTVRVNPADIETMRENRDRLMLFNDIEHMRVIEDQRVDRGGVVIETEAGTIDAKVSTQLREVRRLLAVDEPMQLPASPDEELLHSPAQAS
jgi:flagellar biosynthesis/type III secretory pathway protein FliH